MPTTTAIGADQLRIREDPVYRKIEKPVRHWGTAAPVGGVNLGAYYVSVSGGDVQPRHHHVFEQIRFIKSGSMTYGRNRVALAGDCVYFPESVPYGPVTYDDGEFLLIQWPGPSEGGAFFAVDDADAAAAQMRQTMGSFELDKGGMFRHRDGRLQDGYEAVAEYLLGRPLQYAPPRYVDQVLMRTAAFTATDLPGVDGVRIKHLGYFNEVGPNVKLLELEAGASLPAHRSVSQQVWSVLDGEIEYEGRAYAERSLIHVDPDAERGVVIAPAPAVVLTVHLGTPRGGPIPFIDL
jgi:quercetin dioxygenase-like cupin family protein